MESTNLLDLVLNNKDDIEGYLENVDKEQFIDDVIVSVRSDTNQKIIKSYITKLESFIEELKQL